MNTAKIDLHLHLDGSIDIDWAYKTAKRENNCTLDFDQFYQSLYPAFVNRQLSIKKFDLTCALLQSEQALVESSYLLGKRLAESGMIYAEIRFASQQHCQKGLTQKQAVQAVCYGLKQVEKQYPDIDLKVIDCMMHKSDSAKANEKENLETIEDSKKTFVYDLTEDAWHYRASYDKNNHLTYWRYNHATYAYSKIYVGTDNALCYMDENKYTEHDNKVIYKMRRGGVLTSNNCPFFIDELRLISNQGQHSFNNSYTNLEMNPRVSFRWSWDGSTFSDYQDAYLGKIGNYTYDTSLFGLGMGTFFTLEISTTEPIPFAIESVMINYSPCSFTRPIG